MYAESEPGVLTVRKIRQPMDHPIEAASSLLLETDNVTLGDVRTRQGRGLMNLLALMPSILGEGLYASKIDPNDAMKGRFDQVALGWMSLSVDNKESDKARGRVFVSMLDTTLRQFNESAISVWPRPQAGV